MTGCSGTQNKKMGVFMWCGGGGGGEGIGIKSSEGQSCAFCLQLSFFFLSFFSSSVPRV